MQIVYTTQVRFLNIFVQLAWNTRIYIKIAEKLVESLNNTFLIDVRTYIPSAPGLFSNLFTTNARFGG